MFGGDLEMPVCEICEENASMLFRCRQCNLNICSDCGDPSARVCDYCQEEATFEEDLDEDISDDEDWE